MRFHQFDTPHDLGNLFEQAATGARDHARAVQQAARQEEQRKHLAAIVACYDRAVARGDKFPSSMMSVIEAAKRALP